MTFTRCVRPRVAEASASADTTQALKPALAVAAARNSTANSNSTGPTLKTRSGSAPRATASSSSSRTAATASASSICKTCFPPARVLPPPSPSRAEAVIYLELPAVHILASANAIQVAPVGTHSCCPGTRCGSSRYGRRSRLSLHTVLPVRGCITVRERRERRDQILVRMTHRHFAIFRTRVKPYRAYNSSGPVWR